LPGLAKRSARQRSGYDVRICNIGRLVPLKGQTTIIQALAELRETLGYRAHLTIVYGDVDDELAALKRLVESLQLQDEVTFRASLNFDEEPDFFHGFDVYVSSSTFKNGLGSQTESFGLSILEAILAGLPVVVTNVGGQPEVLGTENRFGRL